MVFNCIVNIVQVCLDRLIKKKKRNIKVEDWNFKNDFIVVEFVD